MSKDRKTRQVFLFLVLQLDKDKIYIWKAKPRERVL